MFRYISIIFLFVLLAPFCNFLSVSTKVEFLKKFILSHSF